MTNAATTKPRHSSLLLLLLSSTWPEFSSAKSNCRNNDQISFLKRAASFGGKTLGAAARRGCHYDDGGGFLSLYSTGSTNTAILTEFHDDGDSNDGMTDRCQFNALDSQLEVSDCFPNEYNREHDSRDDKTRTTIRTAVVRESVVDPTVEQRQQQRRTLVKYVSTSLRPTRAVGLNYIRTRVQDALRECYTSSPGAAYFTPLSDNHTRSTGAAHNVHAAGGRRTQRQRHGELASLTSSVATETELRPESSLRQQPPLSNPPPREDPERGVVAGTTPTTTRAAPSTAVDTNEIIEEPSAAVLVGITQPIVSKYVWSRLTGREFYFPSVLQALVRMGIRIALPQSEEYIDWKPADSGTKQMFQDGVTEEALRHALDDEMNVLVWTGKFKKEDGYGSELPVVKTVSIIPMSPKRIAELLMDSDRVKTYNKMSLGRKDEVTFQYGVDTVASSKDSSTGFTLDGEAKIVRNLTQPPVSKKMMEFITLMYARRLTPEDNIGVGIMGGSSEDNLDDDDGDSSCGYVVMSRAVSGGRWGHGNTALAIDGDDTSENSAKQDRRETTRSEILLGVNLLRSIPGQPNRTELTALTHVKAGAPGMLAVKIGVRGATNFVRDIRSLCE